MIASTCLAVLFVPSYYTVLQRFEEWRKARKQPKAPSGPGGGLSPSAAE
jgi:HAE1 family hydrophobic/amphiphilic exporter-1